MAEHVFIFNPLTAFFLSGVATQLFVLICDHDNRKKKTNRLSVKDSDKRVLRWQSCFDKFCIEMFSLYSKNYESEHFSDDANHVMSPFEVHSAILISVSRIILFSVTHGNLGRKTLKNVSEWFKLITSLAESRLGFFFGQQTQDDLMKIAQEYRSFKSHNHGRNYVDYPHFSPGALFIRSAFVVNLHRDHFQLNLFAVWEESNALFLSDFLHLSDYFNTTIDNEECHDDHYFSPSFPYIHHLPRKKLYETWKLEDQIIHPVPIHLIFFQILKCIHGKAITFQSNNLLPTSNHRMQQQLEKEQEYICAFATNAKQLFLSLKGEIKLAGNCEKQRRYQMKKKQRQNQNFSCTKQSPSFHHGWSCPFLFPARYFHVVEDVFEDNDDFESLVFAC